MRLEQCNDIVFDFDDLRRMAPCPLPLTNGHRGPKMVAESIGISFDQSNWPCRVIGNPPKVLIPLGIEFVGKPCNLSKMLARLSTKGVRFVGMT